MHRDQNSRPAVPTGSLHRGDRRLLTIASAAGCLALFGGWRLFWFLTDDAFIAFRYVSNAHLGHGYVWNAPPFLPVEGYTSFLWTFLLDMVWRATGVAPPDSVNWISLLFACGTLTLAGRMLLNLPWNERLRPAKAAFLGLLYAYLLLNRTFLAWSSSGLETAMFNFLVLLWASAMLFPPYGPRRLALAGGAAAALALTRPDGLLYGALTAAAVLLAAAGAADRRAARRLLVAGLAPLSVVVVHQVWRLAFYGAWLPNTYYAKVSGAWPQSGVRYLWSFTLEYALWAAAAVAGWALAAGLRRGVLRAALPAGRAGLAARAPQWAGVLALLLHFGYYTFVVGGDHFEFRVYSHLLPLIFLGVTWCLIRLDLRPRAALAAAGAVLLLSLPLPWTHWALTKDLQTRAETHVLRMPVAPSWPAPVRWYAAAFDRAQAWLIPHHVGMRHQEHKIFWKTQLGYYPTREQGLSLGTTRNPTIGLPCVGVPSWTMPHVNIIDTLGLNDYVIARTPLPRGLDMMAHSRRPPAGYLDSYQPNVLYDGKIWFVRERTPPLTAARIGELERDWRERADAGVLQPETSGPLSR